MNVQQESDPGDGEPFPLSIDAMDVDTETTPESESESASTSESAFDPIQFLDNAPLELLPSPNPPSSPPPNQGQPVQEVPSPTRIATDPIAWTLNIRWPASQIPVEIFELITSHITRAEVRTLRLVCREFEAKVSAQYFRNVVVPFRSELYSSLDRDSNGVLIQSPSSLFSNGMRIFESFGPHILRFALSLELDEGALAYPPVKPVQEAVPAFWGLYRWPHAQYHRYTDLEGLEQTADETDSMRAALRCLSKVSNLGLCCDAGLGFLIGPDKATRDASMAHPVFATQDWRQDQRTSQKPSQPVITVADFNGVAREKSQSCFDNPASFKRRVLETMISDAGYSESQVEEAIRVILRSEGTNIAGLDFDERVASRSDGDRGGRRSLGDFSVADEIYDIIAAHSAPALLASGRHPLIPASLTRAQKELLLELDWAHRAMIQSYVLCLVDNSRQGCFNHLTTLTIAKIPSSHLNIFYRDDFWEGIPSLRNVSLGVIADWRRITKPPPGFINDIPVSPLDAVGKAYHLLKRYIGLQENIESVRFEWICGGEFAPSSIQRNQYILPAPFFGNPRLMAGTDSVNGERTGAPLLKLPYIKHLALKNCWISPHVFHQMVRQTALQRLEKLELESVSLSGPPTDHAQAMLGTPGPYWQHGGHGNLVHIPHVMHLVNPPDPVMANHTGLVAPQDLDPGQDQEQDQDQDQDDMMAAAPDPEPTPSVPGNQLRMPEFFAWEGIVEHFSPRIKVRHLIAQHYEDYGLMPPSTYDFEAIEPYVANAHRLRHDEEAYKLKTLSFKSCGYVVIDSPTLDTRAILPLDSSTVLSMGGGPRVDPQGNMQHCKDRLLGRISPFMPVQEVEVLTGVFGMEMGWEGVYGEGVVKEASGDGVDKPGAGRFSGVLGG